MTALTCTPAAAFPPMPTWSLRAPAGLAELRARMRSGLLVAAFVLAATLTALAEEALQDWFPGVLAFPDDMEVISAREIGSSLRMFSFATAQDGEALLAEWETALREDGYQITQSRDDIIGQAVEFSGDGILNAKVLVAPQSNSDLSVIEIDATLR